MTNPNPMHETTTTQSRFAKSIWKILQNIPVSRKIRTGIAAGIVLLSFTGMFLWVNKTNYQVLYRGLSPDDVSAIAEKLDEKGLEYQVEGYGSIIKVPAEKLHDTRLFLAEIRLPEDGSIGYDFFTESDFGTTEFLQQMNYKRALQQELSRTIKEFNEIEDARVMIVSPKDSVVMEDATPPSASVLLKLKAEIPKKKIQAIVYLVAGSIKGMSPERVTVVDTKGRVLSRAIPEEEKPGEQPIEQLNYKISFEQNLSKRIQTMLEKIVGIGGAIVRVTADMDFKQDMERQTEIPVGVLERLSVAVVLDGTYAYERAKSGEKIRKYIARNQEELDQFKKIVQNAMGYSEDREDQVTVESFPFASIEEFQPETFDWKLFLRQYGRHITNFFLVFLLFLFVVIPLLKTMKEIKTSVIKSLPFMEEKIKGLPETDIDPDSMPDLERMKPGEKSTRLAKQNMVKAVNIFRNWLTEDE